MIDYYILLRKTCYCEKRTSHCLKKGDFDCIEVTLKFWYWSCSDAQNNRKKSGCGPERGKTDHVTDPNLYIQYQNQ